jgi:Zn-dependent M28 family amino/carboxypeptidase
MLAGAVAAQEAPQDEDTAAWWKMIGHLSSDAHEGRDTGSPGHARAVDWVAKQFAAAGLKPAGDAGGWTQTVPLQELRIDKQGTSFRVTTRAGVMDLRFLHDIALRVDPALPERLSAAVVFRGYCGKNDVGADTAGKIVLCYGARRPGLPGAGERMAATTAAGAAAIINIDDIGYTLEPPRWPQAYARRITLRNDPAGAGSIPVMGLNVDALPIFLAGSGIEAGALLEAAMAGAPLTSNDLSAQMDITLARTTLTLESDNLLAMLPGTDPALAGETLVVSAHIDGYGFGEAVDGDALYNGAFDDAAYVAALIRLAQNRDGKGYRRPVLFAVFTGEEKGLLGARWFVEHGRPAEGRVVADINLDAIRPLFPLKSLTLIGLENSSLVDHVRAVAGPMGIEVRPDLEPIRGMIGRTDAAPFLRAGIPAVSFMFGYDNGSDAEARFREWYRTRYHRPQDDISQPIDFVAARDFNSFFYALTARVADADAPPTMVK